MYVFVPGIGQTDTLTLELLSSPHQVPAMIDSLSFWKGLIHGSFQTNWKTVTEPPSAPYAIFISTDSPLFSKACLLSQIAVFQNNKGDLSSSNPNPPFCTQGH